MCNWGYRPNRIIKKICPSPLTTIPGFSELRSHGLEVEGRDLATLLQPQESLCVMHYGTCRHCKNGCLSRTNSENSAFSVIITWLCWILDSDWSVICLLFLYSVTCTHGLESFTSCHISPQREVRCLCVYHLFIVLCEKVKRQAEDGMFSMH